MGLQGEKALIPTFLRSTWAVCAQKNTSFQQFRANYPQLNPQEKHPFALWISRNLSRFRGQNGIGELRDLPTVGWPSGLRRVSETHVEDLIHSLKGPNPLPTAKQRKWALLNQRPSTCIRHT